MYISSVDDLQRLIDAEVSESSNLEYKAAQAIGDRAEIQKDVSSMANGAGGIIIYGLIEKDNKPATIDPILNSRHSREYLDQVISAGIQPSIKFKTEPIAIEGGYVYAVHIEQGETAHMALEQKRYYRRYNFIGVAMEDYEVRDIMHRAKHPRVVLNVSFEADRLVLRLKNESKVLARDIRCFYWIPKHFITEMKFPFEWRETKGVGGGYHYYAIDTVTSTVLHGGLSIELASYELTGIMCEGIRQKLTFGYTEPAVDKGPLLDWTVYADNAAESNGTSTFYDCLRASKGMRY